MSNEFFNKCNKELNQLLQEANKNPEKTTSLMASAVGVVAILMADTNTRTLKLPAENDMSLILQMLPNQIIEATDKAFEEYMAIPKPPVH